MDLQLGLALPTISTLLVKKLDFNFNGHCVEDEPMEIMKSNPFPWNNKKRSFDYAFEFEQVKPVPKTLSLLNWNKHPDDEEDPKNLDDNSSFASNKKINEDGIVGWPPIKNSRKKLVSYQYHGGGRGVFKNNQRTVANGNSMYVKVKMEGVAIARKIDISLYNSFETLTIALTSMFSLWHQDSDTYKLTYQDGEGDWLIAQDVPWRTFIGTVHRLKLSKNCC